MITVALSASAIAASRFSAHCSSLSVYSPFQLPSPVSVSLCSSLSRTVENLLSPLFIALLLSFPLFNSPFHPCSLLFMPRSPQIVKSKKLSLLRLSEKTLSSLHFPSSVFSPLTPLLSVPFLFMTLSSPPPSPIPDQEELISFFPFPRWLFSDKCIRIGSAIRCRLVRGILSA